MLDKARDILKKVYGYDSFRDGQERLISSILNGVNSVGIMPTGGGKSICYQIPALIFDGVTLVVSPLISLMKDQVDNLIQLGVTATFINSSLSLNEISERIGGAVNGEYKIIYLAPERLDSEHFADLISRVDISMVAIDEAHCISQWGHDFRPSYTKLSNFISQLDQNIIVTAFTATATPRVREDIVKNLKLDNPNIFISGFDRGNLSFTTLIGEDKKRYISEYIEKHRDEAGIVYVATRKDVESLYTYFISRGYKVGKYHAGMNSDERKISQNDFSFDRYQVMFATNAFGMGIDKSNVRYVIHYNMPKNIESYYQEAGRAGRDGEKAECILLYSPQDLFLQKYFIENSDSDSKIKESERVKLESMNEYCYTDSCLRVFILNYFGEEYPQNRCDNCSSCNIKSEELEDITIESQKIISCVVRVKEGFGLTMISDILRGSSNKKVLENGFQNLTTYGLMKEYKAATIKDMINTLIAQKHLILTGDTYPVLKLLPSARAILKGDEKIYFRKRVIQKRRAQKFDNIDATYDHELFQIMRELRSEIATREGVPPYIIFSDSVLKNISIHMPTSKDEMLSVKGIGERKLETYGTTFMEKVKNYMAEKGIVKNPIKESVSEVGSYSDTIQKRERKRKEKKEATHIISYKLYEEGYSISEIAKKRDLVESTIGTHLIRSYEEGKELDFYQFFSKDEEREILEAAKRCGGESLSLIKESIRDDISYFKIKAVLAKNF